MKILLNMALNVGDVVFLKSFLSLEIAPSNIKAKENYWSLIGCSGTIVGDEAKLKMPRHPRGERVLIKFNQNLNEAGLESHNEVENSLWIFVSDLSKINREEGMFGFWNWFALNATKLFDCPNNRALGDELSEHLAEVHPLLEWEIGPHSDGSMYFAISPDMNASLIELAGQVIAHHPNLENAKWCFQVGRQRRPWSDVIRIAQNEKSSFSEIDLSQWKHLVFRVPDSELLDVVFSCGESCPFSDDDIDEVATLLAVGLLGEMVVLERVDQIEVVKAFDGERAKRAKPAEWLPYAFGMKPL